MDKNVKGSVDVSNFPSSQVVEGSVDVSNFPSTQAVSGSVDVGNFPATQAVSGSVDVGNFPTTQAVSGSVDVGNFPNSQVIEGSVSIDNLPSTQTVEGEVVVRNKIRDYRKNDQCWVHDAVGYIDATVGGYSNQFISVFNESQTKYTYIYNINSILSHPINSTSGGNLSIRVRKIKMDPELDGENNVITPSGGVTKDAMSMSMLDSLQDHTECRVGNPATNSWITSDISTSMFQRSIKLNSASGSDRTESIISEDFHYEFLELPPLTGIAIEANSNDDDVNIVYSANIKFIESDTRI